MTPALATPRIGILVVAYNAEQTLASVLDRIPAHFRPRITKVLVSDDHSPDQTFAVGVDYLAGTDLPIEVVHQSRNLGYGGNQKAGYHWAIEHDLDIVVMLHGDGQYAPEFLPEIVEPLLRGEADAVFGSRMLDNGGARKGGMPLYKYAGNKALTRIQNRVTGASLSEWHSGYRAYSVAALKRIPFERNDQGFRFDTQIILQLIEARMRIVEVAIPTFYGDEVCYVNGMKYAREITADVVRYRLHRLGIGSGDLAFNQEFRRPLGAPERAVIERLDGAPSARILDLSPDSFDITRRLVGVGHEVVGIEDLLGVTPGPERNDVDERMDELEEALAKQTAAFDMVIALDVLARVRDPERLLRALHASLTPFGRLIASVPNIEHWYPRLRIGAGAFDYDRRGILDRSHLRLFSHRAMARLATRTGWWIGARHSYGVPFELLAQRSPEAGAATRVPRWMRRIDARLARRWPTLFGYVLLYELEPAAPRGAARASSDAPAPATVDLGVPRKYRGH